MEELIKNYDFDAAKYGTTYDAVLFEFPAEDAFYLVGAKIYLQLRKKPGSIVAALFSTENDKLEILTDYSFQLKTQIIKVDPDTYYHDILIVFPDDRRDIMIGGTWTINPSITIAKP